MQLKKPKALIFDWDNTIVDTKHIIFSALNKALQEFGQEPLESYLNTAAREEYFRKIFPDNWRNIEKLFKSNLATESFGEITFFPDIVPLLENIKKDNIFTAIVSNKVGDLLRKEVQYFNLDKYFNKVVGSGDTPNDKPSPDPIFFALQDCDALINVDNIYFVGDSITDLRCARNANVRCILYHSNPIGISENVLKVESHYHLMKSFGY